jgi:FG-GAP-like repeat
MRFRYIAASPLFLMIFVTMVFGGTFRTAPHFPAGNSPSAIGEGDFNHDGKLDLVVANNGDSIVQIFLGEGKGMFKAQAPIPLDGAPVALAVGDFNRDGILDVVALTQDVFVLLGNGDGTFRFGGIFGAGTVSWGARRLAA